MHRSDEMRFQWRALTSLCLLICGGSGVWAQSAADSSSAPAAPAANTWLRVVTDDVNVRSKPDENSVIVTQVGRDTLLQATREEFGWYQILPPADVFSYVAADYVDRRGADRGIVSVRSGSLRVRVGSTQRELDPEKAEVQALLPSGTEVQVVGEQGTWLRIVPPTDVRVYISAQFVRPATAQEIAEWRARQPVATPVQATAPTTAPTSAPATTTAATTQPAPDAQWAGAWGQKLVALEQEIRAEAAKPVAVRQWGPLIERLDPIAAQQTEPLVARVAAAWRGKLEQRMAAQDALQEASDVLRKAEREREQHARELSRIEELRRRATERPAFDARGEIRKSFAAADGAAQARYKLMNPATREVEAYLAVPEGKTLDFEPYVGEFVGVRGARRFDVELGADVLTVDEIVVLRRATLTTRPAGAAKADE